MELGKEFDTRTRAVIDQLTQLEYDAAALASDLETEVDDLPDEDDRSREEQERAEEIALRIDVLQDIAAEAQVAAGSLEP